MTKEELEKATRQELIEQRDYCGVDGYYGDYFDNVNAEMLKRFNRLAEQEDQLTKAKEIIKTFLGFAEAFGYSPSMDKFIAEAEQFIKDSEVEK